MNATASDPADAFVSDNALSSGVDGARDPLFVGAPDLAGTAGGATIDAGAGGQAATDTPHATVAANPGGTSVGTLAVGVPGANAIAGFNPGYEQAALLKADGSVWMWGRNDRGQLGYGAVSAAAYSATPTMVALPVPMKFAGSGYQYSIALSADGTSLYTWGDNTYGELGIGKAIAGGYSVTPMLAKLSLPAGVTVTCVADGGATVLILRSDGVVMAWGNNAYGQCGLDPATAGKAILKPTVVPGLTNVATLTGGDDWEMALKNDGTVWTWGRDQYGQAGPNGPPPGGSAYSAVPTQVTGLPTIKLITSGGDAAEVVDVNGHVWQWGRNLFGELGNGTFDPTDGPHPTPTMAVGLSDVVAIDGQGPTAAAVDASGTIYAWGFGKQGQIGNGKLGNAAVPTKVMTLPMSPDPQGQSIRIAMSHYTPYAYNEVTGQIFGWGQNAFGQLATSSAGTSVTSPIDITNAVMGGGATASASLGMSFAAAATQPIMACDSADYPTPSYAAGNDLVPGAAGPGAWSDAASTAGWRGLDATAIPDLRMLLAYAERPVYG